MIDKKKVSVFLGGWAGLFIVFFMLSFSIENIQKRAQNKKVQTEKTLSQFSETESIKFKENINKGEKKREEEDVNSLIFSNYTRSIEEEAEEEEEKPQEGIKKKEETTQERKIEKQIVYKTKVVYEKVKPTPKKRREEPTTKRRKSGVVNFGSSPQKKSTTIGNSKKVNKKEYVLCKIFLDQEILGSAYVTIRNIDEFDFHGVTIKPNAILKGVSSVINNRVEINVVTITQGKDEFFSDYYVYDYNLQKGLLFATSTDRHKREAVRGAAREGTSSLSENIPYVGGAVSSVVSSSVNREKTAEEKRLRLKDGYKLYIKII